MIIAQKRNLQLFHLNKKNIPSHHTFFASFQELSHIYLSLYSSNFAFNSSASSVVFTLISIGHGSDDSDFGSTGGFGTQTNITLFFPTLVVGMPEDKIMLSRTLPRFVSALISNCVLPPSTDLRYSIPTPFSA